MGQPINRDAAQGLADNGRTSGVDDAASRDRVELRVPASAKYLRLARLTVAGYAGDLGFDMQAIEDLRVAVDELCAVAIDGVSDDDHLELQYSNPDGRVRIDGQVLGPDLPEPELHPVARELLGIVADEYDLCAVEGGRAFWIVKGAGALS